MDVQGEYLMYLLAEMRLHEKYALDIENISDDINQVYRVFWNDGAKRGRYNRDYADSKSIAEANKFIEKGKKLYEQERYEDALRNFTEGLAWCPVNDEDLTLSSAYSGRSLVHLKLREYEACLLDTNRALEKRGSENDSLTQTLRNVKEMCSSKWCPGVNKDATDPEDLRDSSNADREGRRVFRTHTFDPPNDLLPNSSSKIELKSLSDDESVWGSMVVATQDIEPGETLSVEKHYATALTNSFKRYTNCSHCLESCYALIACPTCTKTMYCSKSCRINAYDSYHRIECKIIEFYERLFSDWREPIALRVFLHGTKQGAALPTLMEQMKLSDIFKKFTFPLDTPFVSDDYPTILKTRERFNDTMLGVQIREAIQSVTDLVVALRRVSFFPNDGPPTNHLSEAELFAAFLLLNNKITVGRTNLSIVEKTPLCIRISSFGGASCDSMAGDGYCETTIGYSVSALQSLLNYSCNPNTQIVVENRQRVLFATRPIKKGEPLFFAPQHYFSFQNRNSRAPRLLQIGIQCKCDACSNDWPSKYDLEQLTVRFVDEDKKAETLKAFMENIQAVRKKRAFKDLSESDILQLISEIITFLTEHLLKPSFDLLLCEELLIRAMRAYYSDFHRDDDAFIRYLQVCLCKLISRIGRSPTP